MRAPTTLKFGTQKGSPKVNPSIKFGANLMTGSGVMTDYSRKTRSICCHAYRVNRFMEKWRYRQDVIRNTELIYY